MTVESFLCVVFLVSVISAFVILLAMKLGIIEWLQVHGDCFFSEMAGCNFCLSFWVGTVLSVAVAIWTGEVLFLIGGMITAPITRVLL